MNWGVIFGKFIFSWIFIGSDNYGSVNSTV